MTWYGFVKQVEIGNYCIYKGKLTKIDRQQITMKGNVTHNTTVSNNNSAHDERASSAYQ